MNHIFYSAEELTRIFDSKSVINNHQTEIYALSIDSRKTIGNHHTLFFALKGRHNGHSFINEVYHLGVRSFVIDDPYFNHSVYPDANFYLVGNSLTALQQLVSYHRSCFNYPVIAITGSSGKTIVKEWLYQVLMPDYNIVRNPKSYNSQVGVPLSVWEMSLSDNLAIFEAGISLAGEMEKLASIINPTVGILTNIGEAHSDTFSSMDDKIAEKLKLFQGVDLFIYSPKYLSYYKGKLPGKKQFSWNFSSSLSQGEEDLLVEPTASSESKLHVLKISFKGQKLTINLPFIDYPSIENAITCLAALLALGYSLDEASNRLQKLTPLNMRLELKEGINSCSLIEDSSVFDIYSLTIALDFLKQQQQYNRRTVILSDINTSLAVSDDLVYKQIATLLENKSIDCLIGIGEQISRYASLFSLEKYFFKTTDDFLNNLPMLKFFNQTILIKGGFEFDLIRKALAQKVHETILEVNLNALVHNLNYYKSLLKPEVKLMAMVKAFSYGSGSYEIASVLEYNKVDYLAVAYPDEGVSLRKAGIKLPIMVMSPDLVSLETLLKYQLEPEIYSPRVLDTFIRMLDSKQLKNYPIHIKLDTGMHRLGFMENEIDSLIDQLKNTDTVLVKSTLSHLVASEDAGYDDFTQLQIQLFDRLSKKIETQLGYSFIRHIANTSGIDRFPNAQFDMVRLGIGLYGINKNYPNSSSLQTVTSLKTNISQIKEIPPGDTIGYGREGKMPHGGKTATVKIGYADGYNQALGKGVGKMLINNQYAPTIGKICMDMTMLDVTHLNVAEGDEVIVFNEQLKVEAIAKQLNVSPYEILTGISQRVKRVYLEY